VTDHPRIDALFVTFLALLWGAVLLLSIAIYICSTFSGSICPLLMTLCYDFWSYTFVCIMFGISLSAWPALSSSMLVELLGLPLLTSAFGVLTCMRGAGTG
jgi:hypothetical protein